MMIHLHWGGGVGVRLQACVVVCDFMKSMNGKGCEIRRRLAAFVTGLFGPTHWAPGKLDCQVQFDYGAVMLRRKNLAPTTMRGAATRARIIEAASRLVAENGVAGTRLEDVMEASGTSKSQIYHYFADRQALMCAVVEARSQGVLDFQSSSLDKVRTLEDLRDWRDKVVAMNRRKRSVGGCPMGSLASELADRSESAREILLVGFDHWRGCLRSAFRAMQRGGQLARSADVDALAIRFLAALQGGLLMAQTMRSTQPLEAALDMALEQVGPKAPATRAGSSRFRTKPGAKVRKHAE